MTDWSSRSTERFAAGAGGESDRARRIVAGRPVAGTVTPPPSKSLTHRYLALALVTGRPLVLERPLVAEDTALFLAALEELGWSVERSGFAPGGGEATVRLAPASPDGAGDRRATIDCGNAGTLFRFLTALLAALPGRFVLDGTPRLRERPVTPLVEALRALGGRIDCPRREGYAPLVVHGGTLDGGRARLDAGASSQYLSALLLAGLGARRPIVVEVTRLASAPYVEVTRGAVRRFLGGGDPVERVGDGARSTWSVRPLAVEERRRGPARLAVEGDWSAACYPAAAAVLTGGRVLLTGVERASAQGDRRLLDRLTELGGRVDWRGAAEVEVAGPPPGEPLADFVADLGELPDQVPTLAALAPFTAGGGRIENVAHLRIKESDRLAAMAEGLRRLGARVEERPDGLAIAGGWPRRPAAPEATAEPVVVDSHGDHRIAMSFALVGLARPGVAIAEPRVVDKSYPDFWRDLDRLLGG